MKKQLKHYLGWAALIWCCIALSVPSGLAQNDGPAQAQKAPAIGGESSKCCAFSLQFINLYDSKYVKSIRVSGMCDTRICCSDADEWGQISHAPHFVDWFPADSSAIPFGDAIDNEFLIYLSSDAEPFHLQVEWFDADNNVVCRHTIEISCSGHVKEDEDWTQYTSKTALNDDKLFVFAVREEDEDEDACDDLTKGSDCGVLFNISCMGISSYYVDLIGSGEYELYNWAVVSGPEMPSINPEQHTSVILTLPGTYIITLNAAHLDTGDSCTSDIEVIIPEFAPNFTYERIPSPCSATFKFTAFGAADPAMVSQVVWDCQGMPSFPSTSSYGNDIQQVFTTPGNYTVTMTLMDIYGCAHTITKVVEVSFDCHAGGEVESYELCGGCTGPHDLPVLFHNTSTGGTCPLTFTWNFGDGQTATTSESQLYFSHTYSLANCAATTTYYVTVTMTDSSPTPCSSTKTFPVVIAPCRPDVHIKVCPDGKVICTATVPGSWSFSPSLQYLPQDSSVPDADSLQTKFAVMACETGTYTLTFIGHCSTGGRCTITRTISVEELYRCAKHDRETASVEFPYNDPNPPYKMKCIFVQRQFILYHRIKVKTKLKKHKYLLGHEFWKSCKADQIEARCDGIIYKSDGECNCTTPKTINDEHETDTNKSKIKLNYHVGERYRSRLDSIKSTHRVVKDGYDISHNLFLGNDCDGCCN